MNSRSPFDSTRRPMRRLCAALLTTTLTTSLMTSSAVLASFSPGTVARAASAKPAASTATSSAVSPSAPALPDKAACVAASDQGQSLRDGKHFIEARRALLACAQDACPSVVRADCAQWLTQVDASVPTLAVLAHDGAGNDILNVRVIIDGEVIASSLTGDSIAVDPGPHHVRLEGPNGAVIERDILVREGEKNRGLNVTFGAEPATATSATAASGPTVPPKPPPPAPASGAPTGAYVLGAVGILAIGSFAYFGLKGRSDVNNLRDTCGLYCASSDITAAHTKLYVSDASLLVGVGTLAVATYLFLHTTTSEGPPPPRTGLLPTDIRFDASPVSGGGVAFLSGRF